eukprot:scaffold1598_cov259-Chaetoceros_neogracile.AAC.16
MTLRPAGVLKKNTLTRKGPVLPRPASNSGTPSTTSKTAAVTVELEGISAPAMDATASFQAGSGNSNKHCCHCVVIPDSVPST